MTYNIVLTSSAEKDAKKLSKSYLKAVCERLLKIIESNPYEPPYEKLNGDMDGFISRRINGQHRLVYKVLENIKTIKVHRMWSHYE
jgi:toxin YoeB